jgi:hypothetical protein
VYFSVYCNAAPAASPYLEPRILKATGPYPVAVVVVIVAILEAGPLPLALLLLLLLLLRNRTVLLLEQQLLLLRAPAVTAASIVAAAGAWHRQVHYATVAAGMVDAAVAAELLLDDSQLSREVCPARAYAGAATRARLAASSCHPCCCCCCWLQSATCRKHGICWSTGSAVTKQLLRRRLLL